MPRRSTLLMTVGWLAFGCACNRTEEPAAPTATEAGGTTPSGGGSASAAGGSGSTTSMPLQPSAGAPMTMPVCTVPLGAPAPLAGKAAQCPKDPTGNLKLPLGRVTFVDAQRAPSVEVELARDDASRSRGLMYRTSMPESSGMLFSWQDERVRSFWMRNTCIPLDLLYISKDGIISGIREQVPTLSDTSVSVACPVAHVLELNAGWTRSHGITPGMKVTIEG
jgi:uncharacterized membrane protein (UPF0127 family)